VGGRRRRIAALHVEGADVRVLYLTRREASKR
jgi:hypothetical protein